MLNRGLMPYTKLVILNGASFTGRLSPGLLVKYIPVVPLITIMAGAGAVLIFGMAGISTVAGFVVFGLLYGFCAGAGGCHIDVFLLVADSIEKSSHSAHGSINCCSVRRSQRTGVRDSEP